MLQWSFRMGRQFLACLMAMVALRLPNLLKKSSSMFLQAKLTTKMASMRMLWNKPLSNWTKWWVQTKAMTKSQLTVCQPAALHVLHSSLATKSTALTVATLAVFSQEAPPQSTWVKIINPTTKANEEESKQLVVSSKTAELEAHYHFRERWAIWSISWTGRWEWRRRWLLVCRRLERRRSSKTMSFWLLLVTGYGTVKLLKSVLILLRNS